jgi:hypothetical protein
LLTRNEEKRLLKALSRVFLNDYPNPERRGCPGSDILKAMASRRLTLEESEPWINHLNACSPCTREFTEFRKNFQRQRILRLSGVAAGLLLVAALGAWLLLKRSAEPVRIEAVTLDLTNRGALRGSEENPPNSPLQLAKGHLDLTIYLPVGSEAGIYEMQVVREPGQPIWSAQGEVKLENYKATLRVQADLSRFNPGLYLLAIRPKGWSWSYYAVLLK